MSEELHPLAQQYFEALDEISDDVRARRALEESTAATLTGGHHVCVRGVWRAGKSTLLKGALLKACERTGGAAFRVNVAQPDGETTLATTGAEVLGRVAARVDEFLKRVGAGGEVKASPARPFDALGELAAPIFVGVTDTLALGMLKDGESAVVLDALLTTPKNVRVAVVAHTHRSLESLVMGHVVPRTAPPVVVGPVSDDELVQLVNGPAQATRVAFSNEALGVLAEMSGNRPWELLTLASLAASGLAANFRGTIPPERVEEVVTLDALSATEQGRELIETYLRILVTAFPEEQRRVVEMLATGVEGEASEAALACLEAHGWISGDDGGMGLTSGLMEAIASAVAQGDIKVAVEPSA